MILYWWFEGVSLFNQPECKRPLILVIKFNTFIFIDFVFDFIFIFAEDYAFLAWVNMLVDATHIIGGLVSRFSHFRDITSLSFESFAFIVVYFDDVLTFFIIFVTWARHTIDHMNPVLFIGFEVHTILSLCFLTIVLVIEILFLESHEERSGINMLYWRLFGGLFFFFD